MISAATSAKTEKTLPAVMGPYIILELIAKGGISLIYRARKRGVTAEDPFHEIAFKRLRPEFQNQWYYLRLFRHEARLGVLIEHPNWVKVLGSQSAAGVEWIEMEYVKGIPLYELVRLANARKIVIPEPIAIFIAIQILKGLQYLHEKVDPITGNRLEIVVRDLSPENILISKQGEVKLLDLGVARSRWLEPTERTETLMGKPGYFSPEQLFHEPLTQRSDIFSYGIILYELLTQRRLFAARTHSEMLGQMRTIFAFSHSLLSPNVDPKLDEIVLRSVERNPEDRFATVAELLAELMEVLQNNRKLIATASDLATWLKKGLLKEYPPSVSVKIER